MAQQQHRLIKIVFLKALQILKIHKLYMKKNTNLFGFELIPRGAWELLKANQTQGSHV